jgi:hypothetical protein
MPEFSTSIDIEAPPEVVFAHLVTAERILQQMDSRNQAAVLYDAELPEGTLRFAEFFEVGDGRIQSIKLLYNAAQYRALGGR